MTKPTMTALNTNPLLRRLFALAEIPTPKADAFDKASDVQDEEEVVTE